jgi:predicted nucleic acid-binding protein
LEQQGRLTAEQRIALHRGVGEIVEARAIELVPRDVYASLEQVATERVPRDQRDWPTVALAMVLNAGILTGDNDFLGCGCPTWTVETLRAELLRRGSQPS